MIDINYKNVPRRVVAGHGNQQQSVDPSAFAAAAYTTLRVC